MELIVKNLSKRYGNAWILRDIEFSFAPGTVTGVCGAAGSGKTTLLRVLAGTEKANNGVFENFTAGDVHFAGDGRSGGFLGVFGSSRGASTGKNAEEILERSLTSAKNIILLDEPFAGLDRETRSRCIRRIRKTATELNKSIIVAVADFKHVLDLADTVLMLDGGMIVQAASPQEIYNDPRTSSIAKLTGEINLIDARRLTSSKANLPEFHTINGEHRIVAKQVEKARLGAINKNVTLGIRPEKVVIAMNASFPEDNLIRARMNGVRFEGETSLVDFDADGLLLTARVFKVVGLSIGDECMLGLPPDLISILD
jgi:ABC-type Fe3+/spermidine/putrescine transport system ATPase subunit